MMKRITGRAVAKVYAVTMALSALAAFVVYSQHKASTNAFSSSKVMVMPSTKDAILTPTTAQEWAGGTGTLTKAGHGRQLISGTKTYVGVVLPMSGAVLQVAGSTNTPGTNIVINSATNESTKKLLIPSSKIGRVFDPSQKIIPGSKSAMVFTPEPPRPTNASPVPPQQQKTR